MSRPTKYNVAPKLCTFEGCERKRAARGLCNAHYCQLVRYGELKPIGSTRRLDVVEHADLPCEIPGCEAGRDHAKFCQKHWDNLATLGVSA